VAEHRLADTVLEMIATRGQYRPREWILDHMTCERATSVLEKHLREAADSAGEPWTQGLVVKTSTLDAQRYVNPEDALKFEPDYRYLESCLRKG
jgi:hypothetical protein